MNIKSSLVTEMLCLQQFHNQPYVSSYYWLLPIKKKKKNSMVNKN